jgi:hypothetical protein
MARRIGQLLGERARQTIVGRNNEMALLSRLRGEERPLVIHVSGIPGIGKSTLVEAFADAAAEHASVTTIDCRGVEPTPRGFVAHLAQRLAVSATDAAAIGGALARSERRSILALDNYEVFGLLDAWLREEFLPQMPESARVVLVSRQRPSPGWLTDTAWHGLFEALELQPLPDDDARALLRQLGRSDDEARALSPAAGGVPLALGLVASITDGPRALASGGDASAVLEELARIYLADVADPATRSAIDAACVVRRLTKPLLASMLDGPLPVDLFEALRRLPFAGIDRDGLVIHQAVRDPVAAALRATDPARWRAYRGAAWRQLRAEAAQSPPSDLWRYTADMLYMVENPVVREAFFPRNALPYSVRPAREGDGAVIIGMTARHDGEESARCMERYWWQLQHSFSVVEDAGGRTVGFYCMFEPDSAPSDLLREDPIAAAWARHLETQSRAESERTLFIRRWLAEDTAEMPSPVQAACWIDMKRTYMQLRPELRRVYSAVQDLSTYAPIIGGLQFQHVPELETTLDRSTYHTAVLDFGPNSVDGWLARLAGNELGVDPAEILDAEARELVVGGGRVHLTKLEAGVMQRLVERAGKVVSRADLMENVWGYDFQGASNVVETVIRSLRRKLGDSATLIETVRGGGYRYRVPSARGSSRSRR